MHASKNGKKKNSHKNPSARKIAPNMSIKAFVELGIFSLHQKPGAVDFESAHDILAGSMETRQTIIEFINGIIGRCNNKTEDLAWDFEADALLGSRQQLKVDLDDIVAAIVAAQFGPRIYADIGPSTPSTAEARFYHASTHFVQTVKDALSETGHAQTAEYEAISQPMANRLRYMLIEVGRARHLYLFDIKPFRYDIFVRRLDYLYDVLGYEDNTPDMELLARERIQFIRNTCFSREEDALYEQGRAQ